MAASQGEEAPAHARTHARTRTSPTSNYILLFSTLVRGCGGAGRQNRAARPRRSVIRPRNDGEATARRSNGATLKKEN